MKKIVDGKLCDTEAADEIFTVELVKLGNS